MNNDILIIGESCRDIFVYCDCTRLCPDIPVPALKVIRQTENEGMAKNVQRNILSLNQDCNIITNTNWIHVTKTRYVHEQTNHMFMRVDTDHNIDRIDKSLLRYDYKLIVISDYNKGFLSEKDIEFIASINKTTFLDTKKKIDNWAKNISFIKINRKEYSLSKDFFDKNKKIRDKVIKTIGDQETEYKGVIYGVNKVEVKDLSGAGDTFLAGLVSKYIDTKDIVKAIEFANECSTIVVQKKGVSTL